MKSAKFKMTELGPIPEDWEVKRLGEISRNCSYGVGAEAIPYDGETKYIRITDIDDTSHLFSPQPLTSPSSFSERHIVQENDILVARTGASVGKSYVYRKEDGHLVFAGFLMKVNVFEENARYVFYHTQTDSYKRWVLEESARSGQPGLNLRQLVDYNIPLPPLPEQRRIAAALSDVDELIAAMGKLIEKKRNIKTGTMQQLLTGRKRLPGFGGEWVEKRIGEITGVVTGATPSTNRAEFWGGDILWMSSGELNDKIISKVAGRITVAGFESCSTHMIPIGCVLIGLAGQGKTRGTAAYNLVEMCTNQSIASILPSMSFDSKFLYYYMDRQYDELRLLSAGDGGRGGLTKGLIEKFIVCLPPLLEQRAIAAVLSDMDAEIGALEAEKAKYERIKSGMMQELLKGKTRLR